MVTTYTGERFVPLPPPRRAPVYALCALVCLLLLLAASMLLFDGKARYAALNAPPATACVVASRNECTVRTQGGDAVAFWGYSGKVGIATATPSALSPHGGG